MPDFSISNYKQDTSTICRLLAFSVITVPSLSLRGGGGGGSAVAPLPAVFQYYCNSHIPRGILATVDPVFSDIICDLFHIKKIRHVFVHTAPSSLTQVSNLCSGCQSLKSASNLQTPLYAAFLP